MRLRLPQSMLLGGTQSIYALVAAMFFVFIGNTLDIASLYIFSLTYTFYMFLNNVINQTWEKYVELESCREASNFKIPIFDILSIYLFVLFIYFILQLIFNFPVPPSLFAMMCFYSFLFGIHRSVCIHLNSVGAVSLFALSRLIEIFIRFLGVFTVIALEQKSTEAIFLGLLFGVIISLLIQIRIINFLPKLNFILVRFHSYAEFSGIFILNLCSAGFFLFLFQMSGLILGKDLGSLFLLYQLVFIPIGFSVGVFWLIFVPTYYKKERQFVSKQLIFHISAFLIGGLLCYATLRIFGVVNIVMPVLVPKFSEIEHVDWAMDLILLAGIFWGMFSLWQVYWIKKEKFAALAVRWVSAMAVVIPVCMILIVKFEFIGAASAVLLFCLMSLCVLVSLSAKSSVFQ